MLHQKVPNTLDEPDGVREAFVVPVNGMLDTLRRRRRDWCKCISSPPYVETHGERKDSRSSSSVLGLIVIARPKKSVGSLIPATVVVAVGFLNEKGEDGQELHLGWE